MSPTKINLLKAKGKIEKHGWIKTCIFTRSKENNINQTNLKNCLKKKSNVKLSKPRVKLKNLRIKSNLDFIKTDKNSIAENLSKDAKNLKSKDSKSDNQTNLKSYVSHTSQPRAIASILRYKQKKRKQTKSQMGTSINKNELNSTNFCEAVIREETLKTEIEPVAQDNTIIKSDIISMPKHENFDINSNIPLPDNDFNLKTYPSALSIDSAKGSSIDIDVNFIPKKGDICWGQIANFPYWPCIVFPDSHGKTITLNGMKKRAQNIKYHVRFLADNGRRGWIKRDCILPYEGVENFDKKCKPDTKHRKNKYNPFFIPSNTKYLWDIAVKEADELNKFQIEDRLTAFEHLLTKSRSILKHEKRKRRNSNKNESLSSINSKSFGSNDNSIKRKRDRSTTPVSPPYEDLFSPKAVKKMKLELKTMADGVISKNNSCLDVAVTNSTIYEDNEYNIFYELMKKYILGNASAELVQTFEISVKALWNVRFLTKSEFKDNIKTKSPSSIGSRYFKNQIMANMEYDKKTEINKNVIKNKEKKKSLTMDEVIKEINDMKDNSLYSGVSRENICKVCFKTSNLIKCKGTCNEYLHEECSNKEQINIFSKKITTIYTKHITGDIEDNASTKTSIEIDIYCKECSLEKPKCFICKKNDTQIKPIKCSINYCGKYYHENCFKYWPQAHLWLLSGNVQLLCPSHVCQTCVSDDPRGKYISNKKVKLARCIECPATFHADAFCTPAGTTILTTNKIICPRHIPIKNKLTVNTNWCFICCKGGSLICCENCPASFHINCLKTDIVEEKYICEECQTGRFPLYGEMVWAKLGRYRWWPAIVIPPQDIPLNLIDKKEFCNDFCVRFFGSNNYSWVNRSNVYIYQVEDTGGVKKNKGIDNSYNNALAESKKAITLLVKRKSYEEKINELKPIPFIHIKTNRPFPPIKTLEANKSEVISCVCKITDESPCGPYSECLNRILFTECNPKLCPAGSLCQNQLFERRLYPPLKYKLFKGKGWGLISKTPIQKNSFIIEYTGEVIDQVEFKRRKEFKEEKKDENYYFLTLDKDYTIDAGSKGNLARFINHSCEPNCETQKWNVNGVTRIGIFAIEDIKEDTELTFNYNLESIYKDKQKCHCGAQKCSGFIGEKPEKSTVEKRKRKDIKGKSKAKTILKRKKNEKS